MKNCLLKRALPFMLTLLAGASLGGLVKLEHLSGGRTKDAAYHDAEQQLRHADELYETALIYEEKFGATMNDESELAGEVFGASQVDSRAVPVSKPEPGFTEAARRNNVEGTVRLRLVLSSDGRVRNISVIESLPDGLTEKAIEAARKILFKPALKDGRPVSQWATVEYNFRIY